MTAREIMVVVTAKDDDANYSMPRIKQKIQGTAPKEINAYSDGSLKNTTGLFWHVGGAGVWWPGRKTETLSVEEKGFAKYK